MVDPVTPPLCLPLFLSLCLKSFSISVSLSISISPPLSLSPRPHTQRTIGSVAVVLRKLTCKSAATPLAYLGSMVLAVEYHLFRHHSCHIILYRSRRVTRSRFSTPFLRRVCFGERFAPLQFSPHSDRGETAIGGDMRIASLTVMPRRVNPGLLPSYCILPPQKQYCKNT